MNLHEIRVTFVIGVHYGAEPFLSGGVPYLQLDYLVIDVDGLESEVHPDRNHVVLVELIVCVAQQQ